MFSIFIFATFFFQVQAQWNQTSSVPKLHLDFWNKNLKTIHNNNCYNYATNRVTNSFAQPGEASDNKYTELSCDDVHQAALSDWGLVPTEYFPMNGKEEDLLIALVVAPGYDFHWYRRDDNGFWSHKPGGTPATVYDQRRQKIISPEIADRGYYSDFCGYFRLKNRTHVFHEQNGGQVRIGNLKNWPKQESFLEILKYSGRRNPSFSLNELHSDDSLRELLLKIKNEISTAGFFAGKKLFSQESPRLGYQGIRIVDEEGLISEPHSVISFKSGVVQISDSSGQTAAFYSDAFKNLEDKLLTERRF